MSLRRSLERNSQKAEYDQFKIEYRKEQEKQDSLPPEERKQLIRKPTFNQWKKMKDSFMKRSRDEMIKKLSEKIDESTKEALDTSWDDMVGSVPVVPMKDESIALELDREILADMETESVPISLDANT